MVNLPVLKINGEKIYFSGPYLSPSTPSPRPQTGWSGRGEFEDGINAGDRMWGPDSMVSGMFSLGGERESRVPYLCGGRRNPGSEQRAQDPPPCPPTAPYQPLGFSRWGPLIWVKPLIPAPHLQAECLTSVEYSINKWRCSCVCVCVHLHTHTRARS